VSKYFIGSKSIGNGVMKSELGRYESVQINRNSKSDGWSIKNRMIKLKVNANLFRRHYSKN